MRVTASQEAGRYIRERGGALYVWFRPVGGVWGTVEVATEAPHPGDVEFEHIHTGPFELFLDRELGGAEHVEVELARWPRRHIRVRGLGEGEMEGPERPRVDWDSAGGGGGDGGGGDGGGAG